MADWLTPETSLAGLVVYSFLAATLLPGGSEIALFAYLRAAPDQAALALTLATVANTAGGMTSYLCGRCLPRWQRLETVPHAAALRRWGGPALLLAWAPIVGDLLCVAAGWLKLNWPACLVFMALGKFARYALVGQGALLAG